MAGWSAVRPWWGLTIALLLLALFAVRPLGVDAPENIRTEFDAARAIGRLRVILGDQRPHPADSDANDAVLARLIGQVRRSGFAPQVRDRFHCNDIRKGAAICARTRNLFFWVTAPGDDALMLTAHYDSVPAGPGAADDGMGMAVALEAAHLLKGRPLARPVLVLLTDAEEAGLVGAAAFAAHDPLARRIGAVVNLEARGTTGRAAMFQTSMPNGHDVAALAAGGRVPSANALAADFYALMPNDTDLTMLLPLGVDAANYAVIGGGKRYHTPLDDLAHLDPRSVRQMGADALAAVDGFARAGHAGAEGQRVFINLGRLALLTMPNAAALLCVLFGLAAAVTIFRQSPGNSAVKAMLAPPLALLTGTGLAFTAGALVGALRPEAAFGTGWPIALRVAYGAAALFAACFVVHRLRLTDGVRLAAATWIWLALLVLAAFAFIPGFSILVAWPALFLAGGAIASLVPALRGGVAWLLTAAAALFTLIALPIAGGVEDGLFVEHAWPIAFLMVLMFLVFMPAGGRHVRLAPITTGALLVVATATALVVPAFTRDAPRHVSVIHEDEDGKGALLIPDTGRLPEGMRRAAAFGDKPDKTGHWRAPAPRIAEYGRLQWSVKANPDGSRTVRLLAHAPRADRQEFHFRKGEGASALTVNGIRPRLKGALIYAGCAGRSCRTLDVSLRLAAKGPVPEIRWQRVRYGAGPAAAALVAARPDTAQPVHTGDQQRIVRTVKLSKLSRTPPRPG